MDFSLWFNIAIVGGLLLLLLVSGVWISVALAATGIFALFFLTDGMMGVAKETLYTSTNSYILLAVPLFIFMGELLLRTGMSVRLYRGVSRWTDVIPGSLLHSNIVACAIFAAVSGSSTATCAAIGTVAHEEQTKRGYAYSLMMGSIAAGGTLGILIPPSVIMVVYGAFVNVSVARLFIAGIIPGIILAMLFMVYIAGVCLMRPSLATKREKLTWSYFAKAPAALKELWPILVIMGIVFVCLYGGLTTPTEAAAFACFVSLVICALFGELTFQKFKQALLETVKMSSFVLLILVGASVLSVSMSMLRIPAEICQFVSALQLPKMAIFAATVFLYIILGMFLDGFSMMLITLPVTYPMLIEQLGFDPIWFGIVIVILVEAALITPPVGANFFVVCGFARGVKMGEIIRGILPFVGLMTVALVLFTAAPQLVLWLPNTMFPPR